MTRLGTGRAVGFTRPACDPQAVTAGRDQIPYLWLTGLVRFQGPVAFLQNHRGMRNLFKRTVRMEPCTWLSRLWR